MRYATIFQLAVSCLCSCSLAESIQINNQEFQLAQNVEHEAYDLNLSLGQDLKGQTPSELGVLFGYQDLKNYYHLSGNKDGLSLIVCRDGEINALGTLQNWKPSDSDQVLLQRRRDYMYIEVGNQMVPVALDSTFHKGGLALLTAGGAPQSFRLQPYEAINFADDFMRTDSEQTLHPWELVSGAWKFHSVKEEHAGTLSTHSTNPFSLGGKPDLEAKTAVAVTGQKFWSDYEFAVSMKSQESKGGIIFGYVGKEAYYQLSWDLTHRHRYPRKLELHRIEAGVATEIAGGYAIGGSEQWYRLKVRLRSQRAQIFLDESLVFEVVTERLFKGKVGLFSEGPQEVVFDDISVTENPSFDLDSEKSLSQFASLRAWTTAPDSGRAFGGNHKHVSLSSTAGQQSTIDFGLADWSSYAVSFEVSPKVTGELVFKGAGAETSIKVGTSLLPVNVWRRVEIDLFDSNVLRIYVDGILEDRVPFKIADVRPSLVTNIPLTIRKLSVSFLKQEDRELPTAKNQLFVNDPFMLHWASPQGAWIPQDSTNQIFWHKGDFFGDMSITVPPKPDVELFFSMDQPISGIPNPANGYCASLKFEPDSKKTVITLKKNNLAVATASVSTADATQIPALRLFRDGKYIWMQHGPIEILTYRDAAPPQGTAVAIRSSVALEAGDFSTMKLQRDHVRDETFERAFCDWVRVGTWEVTNRFSCTPTWSHLNGRSRNGASLWNKFEYEGDIAIEYYIGSRMRQLVEEEANILGSYPRNGDFNVSFNCTNMDPTTGYSYLLGAWDYHWNGDRSALLRLGEEVKQTTQHLVPRSRGSQIRDAVAWVSSGRPVHGAWYYVKVRKRGTKFEYYYDNRLIDELCFEDPQPLTGKLFSIWTLDQSIMIARARISYTKRTVPQRFIASLPPVPAPPKPTIKTITSSTNPGLYCDFEDGAQGWVTQDLEYGAALSLDPESPANGKCSLRVTNPALGGTFGAVIPLPQLDLIRVTDFSFNYKVNKETKVDFYLTLGGRNYFLQFTGEGYSDENFKKLGQIPGVISDGKWHRAQVDIAGLVLNAKAPTLCTSLQIGNFHEGYIKAGLTGNPEGASILLDDFQVVTASSENVPSEFGWTSESPSESPAYLVHVGKTNSENIPGETPPQAAATYTSKVVGGLHYLHVQQKGDSVPRKFPFYIQPSLSLLLASPAQGGSWGGTPIKIDIQPKVGLHLDLQSLQIIVGGKLLADFMGKCEYSPELRVLLINLSETDLSANSGAEIPFKLIAKTEAGEAESSLEWQLKYDAALDKMPPSRVTLDTYPKRIDFEGTTQNAFSSTDNIVTIDPSTASSGKQSLKIFKPRVNLILLLSAMQNSIQENTGRHPVLQFDYNIPASVEVDLSIALAVDPYSRQISLTEAGASYPALGNFAAVTDGKWHRADLNLYSLLKGRPFHPKMYELKSLGFGDFGGESIGKAHAFHLDYIGYVPSVSTANGLVLKWSASDSSSIKDYSYHWSETPVEEADQTPETANAEASFTKITEGTQYLHIRARDQAGNWGSTSHFNFVVDNTPPILTLNTKSPADPVLDISFKEEGSGLDVSNLQIELNGKKYALDQNHARWGKTDGTLEWDWAAATDASGNIADGTPLNFAVHQFNDHAGNPCAPFSWAWKVGFAQDKIPPQPPAIIKMPPNIHVFDTFTENVGLWANWGAENGSSVTRHFDAERQDYCLQVVDEMVSGSGGVYITSKEFDARDFTHISFDYKIPAATKIHFMFLVNGAWNGITLTSPLTYSSYKNIGNANIIADNEWHSVVVPLLKILEVALPGTKQYKITTFAISDYYTHYSPANVPYYIDNFCISGPAKVDMAFACKSFDSSGIAGFTSQTSSISKAKSDPVTYASGEFTVSTKTPGMYFLDLRAKDGAGNLSKSAGRYHEVPWTLNTTKDVVKGALLFRAWNGTLPLMHVVKTDAQSAPDAFSVWSQPLGLSPEVADWNFLPTFIPDWMPVAKTKPQNACFRWDGSLTFPSAGNWYLLVSSGLPVTLGLESADPTKFTEFSSSDKVAAGKVIMLAVVNAAKPGHEMAIWIQAFRGTGIFSGLNLWWSQDKSWEALKPGAVEDGNFPKEQLPATAFSYRP
ncbi:MAG: hypothetical protein O3B01_12260 [Planctomycetota bacterium]|nr:hypothetical protein [Planctomycetota bacterium]